MGSVLVFEAPRTVGFADEKDLPLQPDEVRLRTLFSGISAGTELTAYRGSNPYLHKRWDDDRRLFIAGEEPRTYPQPGWGYEEVGEIVERGSAVTDLQIGQRVYGTWGHRTSRTVSADYARARILPAHVEPVAGIFSQIGAIALNGILDAQINVSETVAVFGLGVVGQLVAQLARLSGAHVIAVDLDASRLEMARQLGAHTVLNGRERPAAEAIKELTGGRGADVCIECSGTDAALHEAVRACAYSSNVVAMSFYQGAASRLFLGEEFHHNRITIVGSQIYGVRPALAHRWNTQRLVTAFMGMVADGRLDVQSLITHTAPFTDAARLFTLLDTQTNAVMQAVIQF
ncbi:MAG TPA: zinc-binding alcohol dehydrogenase [Roseiflexaceae bacterium]|jgi:threonine dehydrogenase-like Zn-dependent dehydrogenase|nr:zinc-binding alcohol dehydrogenase [Roseiflexaceae bacterium]